MSHPDAALRATSMRHIYLIAAVAYHFCPSLPAAFTQPGASTLANLSSINVIKGCTKRWAPGSVKLGEKVAFCLPTTGRRMQLFHLIFTKPGAHLLVHPCTVQPLCCCGSFWPRCWYSCSGWRLWCRRWRHRLTEYRLHCPYKNRARLTGASSVVLTLFLALPGCSLANIHAFLPNSVLPCHNMGNETASLPSNPASHK